MSGSPLTSGARIAQNLLDDRLETDPIDQ